MVIRNTPYALVVMVAACGRIGFVDTRDGGGGDGGPDGGADATNGPEVVAELDGAYTYAVDDFVDAGNVVDNLLVELCVLGPPFAERFAVVGGREILTIDGAGGVAHRAFTPAIDGTTGPDSFGDCVFEGTRLWLGGASYAGGDGLFSVDAAWTLTRETTENNVEGLLVDGSDLLYTSDGDLFARPSIPRGTVPNRIPSMVRTSDGGVASVGQNTMPPYMVNRLDPMTFAVIDALATTPTEPQLASGVPAPAPTFAFVVFDERRLVALAANGAQTELAVSASTDDRWTAIAHTGDGAIYVLETNAVLPRHRVLRIPL